MNPAEYGKLLRLGLADGDFSFLLKTRKKTEFDNLVYAINHLKHEGHIEFGVRMEDLYSLSSKKLEAHRFEVWVSASDGSETKKPNLLCNTITDLRGFLLGLLVSHFNSRRNWLLEQKQLVR